MNQSTKWIIGVVVIVVVAVVGYFVSKDPGDPVSTELIKIGAILPLTGSGSYWGEEVQRGMQLALDEINKKSKNLEIIFEDTQSQVNVAVSSAQKLINIDRVNALYGHFSGIALAVSPVAKNANIPFYYSAFTGTPLIDNELSFKGFINFDEPCEKYAKYIKEQGIEKLALINEAGDAYLFCKNGLNKYYSDNNIEIVDSLTGKDFRTMLLQLKSKSIESVVFVTYEPSSASIFKQINDLGINFKSMFCEQNDCYTSRVKEQAGYVSNLIYFDPVIRPEFIEKVEKKYGPIDEAKLTPIAFAYEDTLRMYTASLKCSKLHSSCFTLSLSEGYASEVFEDAPTRERTYYPELQYVLVGDSGQETVINLDK